MGENSFADILLPLAVKDVFTWQVPPQLSDKLKPGMRVLVQFGNKKLYSGIVKRLHNEKKDIRTVREIIKVLDEEPVVREIHIRFWHWLAEYYMCTEGEVMKAAMPSILTIEGTLSSPVEEKFKPKEETFISLPRQFSERELNEILDSLKKAPKQAEILLEWLNLSGYIPESEIRNVRKSLLVRETGTSHQALNALIRKGILISFKSEVPRIRETTADAVQPVKLTVAQQRSFESINKQFTEKDVVLLHGVTSGGKTEIYIHLINEQLRKGKQVLYLLPEIGLTTGIINRLQRHFANTIMVYHSRINDSEKAEIWKRVMNDAGCSLVVGVRSAVFLPLNNLGLIIVDEEHDGSYKQQDPAPRYHARDSAIVLAGLHHAKVLLGSASPSIESYNNAVTGKYGLVELNERYGQIKLPQIILANTREAYKRKLMVSHFTPQLLEAIDEALAKNEQVVLFQNRRGFSPYVECSECGWIPVCANCAVNLTYHKTVNRLVCHYCGFSSTVPSQCGNCGSAGIVTRGFGTEKIEDEIKIIFPSAKVARLDLDTTRTKNSFDRIINAFEAKKIDILIGTQMISKGLDFENLTVVGILNADNLLNYPDFRAHERSFQLMEQVSGRAGRRQKQGKVVIQTSDTSNRIIRLLLRHDYKTMLRLQMEERKAFNYPPFTRMIKIILKHKDRSQLNHFAELLAADLKNIFGKRVLGPEFPVISRIQQWYLKTILLKIEREKPLSPVKQSITDAISRIEKLEKSSSLKISIDVDPY
ncbi:MAG: primosomal protein N' [Bacteroidales bacterium]|nr:primosomal protein N' [Bacteroidales bacterium]